MQAIEIIVIVAISLILIAVIVAGFLRRAKAKKNGTPSCGGCGGCRHAQTCSKSTNTNNNDESINQTQSPIPNPTQTNCCNQATDSEPDSSAPNNGSLTNNQPND